MHKSIRLEASEGIIKFLFPRLCVGVADLEMITLMQSAKCVRILLKFETHIAVNLRRYRDISCHPTGLVDH